MGNCPAEQKWIQEVVEQHKSIIEGGRVLEIGAGIEQHSVHFPNTREYIGLDVVAQAGGVNVVSIAHEYNPDDHFDVVCSFSVLEHDMYWKKTLNHMIKLTRSKGIVIFSCCLNWEEHGTLKTSPGQSYTTQISEEWGNYYRNVTPDDVLDEMNLHAFSDFYLGRNPYDDGLTAFWGVKK